MAEWPAPALTLPRGAVHAYDRRVTSKPPEFHSALQVTPQLIASLSDEQLTSLFRDLLTAECHLCGADPSLVVVNAEIKAPDDGCDAFSPPPRTHSSWLGHGETCWQLKAGVAGQPAKLAREAIKGIPAKTLRSGGSFVVVAAGAKDGPAGESQRLGVLVSEATKAGVPSQHIRVIGSEKLSNWCNQHPAIAMRLRGASLALMTLHQWKGQKVHQTPWQASPEIASMVAQRRHDLGISGQLTHLHIYGPPGVGKTRLALEMCRDAAWKDFVIYVPDASATPIHELLGSAVAQPSSRLVVVADEVDSSTLVTLCEAVALGDGRVRLITVGHGDTTDSRRIPALRVEPLPDEAIEKVITSEHIGLPREQIRFVIQFANGYVRLALMAAFALSTGRAFNVRELLDFGDIRHFLDRMLGAGDRSGLYVAALLTRVGWRGSKENEGITVAKQLGLSWANVKVDVQSFHRKFGIAPSGGEYCYISPRPLALYLAAEACTVFGSQLRELGDMLPTELARDAYYRRLSQVASNPQVQDFGREELNRFLELRDFLCDADARRWCALSAADPILAASNLARALRRSSVEERRALKGRARREIIWTLTRVAWRSSTFNDATSSLALLAEAENETWTNNATGEFVGKFQIVLGGTSVPYPARLSVIDELVQSGREAMLRLAVKALARAKIDFFSRGEPGDGDDSVREIEWHPSSEEEGIHCVLSAIARLQAMIGKHGDTVDMDIANVTVDMLGLLRAGPYRSAVAELMNAVGKRFASSRTAIRRRLLQMLHVESDLRHDLDESDLDAIRAICDEYADTSLEGRLREALSHPHTSRRPGPELTQLAAELAREPSLVSDNWDWLTSGEAGDAWRLGEVVAQIDEGSLAGLLLELVRRGRDFRFVCGYIGTIRTRLGDAWYENWCEQLLSSTPPALGVFVEILWRCGATEILAMQLVGLLEAGTAPTGIAMLGHGRWGDELTHTTMERVLRSLAKSGHLEAVASRLADRIGRDGKEPWLSLTMEFVTRHDLIRSHGMMAYYWKELAQHAIAQDPAAVAGAILNAHVSDSNDSNWFLDLSDAKGVLLECSTRDPAGVWRSLMKLLDSETRPARLTLSFPSELLDNLSAESILAWIAADPQDRAPAVARLTRAEFSPDTTLAAQILGAHGDIDGVARAFHLAIHSGLWWGKSSVHWSSVASRVEQVARSTQLPKLRAWATDAAQRLRATAAEDRRREEEEELDRG